MSKKLESPKVLDVSRGEDEDVTNYIMRMGACIHRPSQEQMEQQQQAHAKRIAGLKQMQINYLKRQQKKA